MSNLTYAHWELITKDETITGYWLDNSNSYTTRPEAIYFELYRIGSSYSELCTTYITERLYSSTADWITNFSNETGVTSLKIEDGNYVYKTPSIFDPNAYMTVTGTYKYKSSTNLTVTTADTNAYNNIFYNGSYVIKMTGDNQNPAGTNTWTVTLENLQKYDTSTNPYETGWVEYDYVAKETTCTSLDDTTQYVTSSSASDNSYQTSLDNYVEVTQNTSTTVTSSSFSNYIVNRISNVQGILDWKNIGGSITFEDMDDEYNFRPDEIVVEIYQNIATEKLKGDENYLDEDSGVRVLYKTIFYSDTYVGLSSEVYTVDELEALKTSTIKQWGYPLDGDTESAVNAVSSVAAQIRTYITVDQDSDTTYFGYLDDTLSLLELEEWKVPTVQESTGIKYTYDIVITTVDGRYRYTLDADDEYNNSQYNDESSGYYYNKHETDIEIPTDNDYSTLVSRTDPSKTLTIVANEYDENGNLQSLNSGEIYMSQVNSYLSSYTFVEFEYGSIYQSILEDDNLDSYVTTSANDKQYNQYKLTDGNSKTTATTATYSEVYESMRYNIRYYEIEEDAYLDYEYISYYSMPSFLSAEKRISYLFYKEVQLYSFTATLLETDDVYLPTEYSGSSSASDRTGYINGENDWTFTKNETVLANTIYTTSGSVYYENVYASALKEYAIDNNETTSSTTFTFNSYDSLDMDSNEEYFLITLSQMEKEWNGSYVGDEWTVTESYANNYSTNGQMTVTNVTSSGDTSMTVVYESNPTNPTTGEFLALTGDEVGNEYNLLLPLDGSGFNLEYLPDGKYEISFHYDIDFDNFDIVGVDGKSLLTEENGVYYITFSSSDESQDEISIIMTADIDTWRGNVDDTSIITQYATPAKVTYANELSSDRTTSKSSGWGYSVVTGMDNEKENSNYYIENFTTN